VNPHRPNGSCMRCFVAHPKPVGWGVECCDSCAELEREEQTARDVAAGECVVCQMPTDSGGMCGACEEILG